MGFCFVCSEAMVWFGLQQRYLVTPQRVLSLVSKKKKKENKNESPFPVKRDTTPGLGD